MEDTITKIQKTNVASAIKAVLAVKVYVDVSNFVVTCCFPQYDLNAYSIKLLVQAVILSGPMVALAKYWVKSDHWNKSLTDFVIAFLPQYWFRLTQLTTGMMVIASFVSGEGFEPYGSSTIIGRFVTTLLIIMNSIIEIWKMCDYWKFQRNQGFTIGMTTKGMICSQLVRVAVIAIFTKYLVQQF